MKTIKAFLERDVNAFYALVTLVVGLVLIHIVANFI